MGKYMKNITIYTPAKYNTDKYTKVKDNIYKTYDNFMKQDSFVTSLSFEQEPEYGEGESSADISQYPLEDILDRYYADRAWSDYGCNSHYKCSNW